MLSGLLFHSIAAENKLTLSAVKPQHFRSMLKLLQQHGYSATTVSDAHAGQTTDRSVLITFDDGCKSFLTQALPVLEELGFKATLFPVAGSIGQWSTWDVMPGFKHLTKDDIRAISGLGHEIGSHGMTHSDLTMLGSADLAAELRESKKILEDITGRAVTALSFPFGSWNQRVWESAQEAGYSCGTLYRKHRAIAGLFPVFGVYRFDRAEDVLARVAGKNSLSRLRAMMMSHFAKGAPLWKFSGRYVRTG
ncbi:MAG: polysaccharide deacetylase family protein [Chitinispirillaceae bacterium]|jgi:peptidoglycan/xylan/chitin deacetylase (PgdA/CDA1 family)|nr:polysaccharide deacetylase family protein [Chitinispirillaceae bacterium]